MKSAYGRAEIRRRRDSEHKGLGHRTGAPLVQLPQSSIRDHVLTCPCVISVDDVNLLAYRRSEHSLRITE